MGLTGGVGGAHQFLPGEEGWGGSGECEHPHMRCPQRVPVEHHPGPIPVGGLEGRWDDPGSGSQPRAPAPRHCITRRPRMCPCPLAVCWASGSSNFSSLQLFTAFMFHPGPPSSHRFQVPLPGTPHPFGFPLALKIILIAFHLQLLHAFSHLNPHQPGEGDIVRVLTSQVRTTEAQREPRPRPI